MKRRNFITLLSGAAAAWPLAARVQQAGMPVVGFVHATAAPDSDVVAAVKQGLRETGYVDGVNASVEYRSAEGRYDRLPAITAEFVQHQVAVIVAGTPVAALAAKQATRIRGRMDWSPVSAGPASTSPALGSAADQIRVVINMKMPRPLALRTRFNHRSYRVDCSCFRFPNR